MSLPVTVVGGYLGAGKTTLVNRLLRNARGLRLAVLVNDFGEVSIDADLIVGADGGVLELAGGCVCCTVGSDLLGALLAMRERDPAPDHVLVETSGVALPRSVAGVVGLATGMRLSGVVVLADAETVHTRAADPYVGDTVERQLRDADLVVLTKTDLAGAARAAALRTWLADLIPRTPVVAAVRGDTPIDLLLSPPLERSGRALSAAFSRGSPRGIGGRHEALSAYESLTLRREIDHHPGLAADALRAALRDTGAGTLLRAKAIIPGTGGQALALHLVGTRIEVESLPEPMPAAGDDGTRRTEPCARLVMIGDRRDWSPATLLARLAALGWRRDAGPS